MKNNPILRFAGAAGVAALVLLASSAGLRAADDSVPGAQEMIKQSFREQGQAKLSWLEQDLAQKACSATKPPEPEVVNKIQAQALAEIKWPSDGKYVGDWKSGEKIAQSGRGMTWRDSKDDENGGSCYNCHQLSKEEISYGTIGPSLYNYGKLRGVADPASNTSEPIVKYTWGKIYNAKAYNACSDMPRLGHAGILTEQQIRDVMALLLDPKSPVNQ